MKATMDNTCVACGAVRKKKSLVFSENYVPYCNTYWVCNENHPNHPRQKSPSRLYSFKEMQDLMVDKLPEEGKFIKQLMTNPFSVRIADYKTIAFLMQIKKEHELESFSDTIRYCIDFVMQESKPSPISNETAEQTKTETTAPLATDNFTF